MLGNERTVLEIQDDEFSAGVLDSKGELELKREPQIGCDVACMVSQWSRQLSPYYYKSPPYGVLQAVTLSRR